MTAKELRIGNYLHDNKERLCRVESIHNVTGDVYAQGFRAPAIKGPVTSLPNKPILLTEEWLVKFGFKAFDSNGIKYFRINKWDVTLDGEFNIWILDQFDSSFYVEIKHVHQLQNLYFALTGEELTCSL